MLNFLVTKKIYQLNCRNIHLEYFGTISCHSYIENTPRTINHNKSYMKLKCYQLHSTIKEWLNYCSCISPNRSIIAGISFNLVTQIYFGNTILVVCSAYVFTYKCILELGTSSGRLTYFRIVSQLHSVTFYDASLAGK